MENFITVHLLCQDVEVCCCGQDKFNGKVVGCVVGTLARVRPNVLTHVTGDKIITVWPKSNAAAAGA